jgi:putative ABC transport system permease protein
LRLAAGRPLAPSDTPTSQRVIVVNSSFARQYLGERPVGYRIARLFGLPDWEVVGVVDDVQQGGLSNAGPLAFGGVADPPQPEMYLTYRQTNDVQSEFILLVRTFGDPLALAPTLRAIVRDEDPSLALESIVTMEDRVLTSLSRPRMYALLVGAFAACALAIAGVGLFGVLSYTTAQRTREIGIRTALGAQPRDIVGLVARQAAGITAAGIVVGLAAAAILVQSLSKVLYGVSSRDIWSFAMGPLLLSVVASLACVVPALRAARIDPLRALK